MNKIINAIGIIVLFGILIKLSYVFIYLFSELDNDSIVSKITGITFAFSSIYFVVKINNHLLKTTMVVLDIFTILYYYLHNEFNIPIEYSSIIVAAYSGLIVYYLGRTINENVKLKNIADADRVKELEAKLKLITDKQTYEIESIKLIRRIKESKTERTRKQHEDALDILNEKYKDFN